MPDRVDVDPVNNELFVIGDDAVLVYPRTANGDVAPIRMIHGPDTQLKGATTVAVDPVHNVIVVRSAEDRNGLPRLVIFNRNDNGNVKPRGVITGPKTGLPPRSNNEQVRVYQPKGWIVYPFRSGGRKDRSGNLAGGVDTPGVAVWSIHDNGDVPPRWVLGGPKADVDGARIALNPKAKEIILAGGDGIKSYYFREIF